VAEELKTAQVNLRLKPGMKVAAEKAAASDHRSLTSYIEKLIADDLETRKANRDHLSLQHLRRRQ
jgi:hypothetical protein